MRLFASIAEVRAITDQWLRVYNQERPHDSLGRVPPLTFLPRPTIAGKSPGNCPLDGELTETHEAARRSALPLPQSRLVARVVLGQ
jgi:hypothetical protein